MEVLEIGFSVEIISAVIWRQ